MYRGFTSEYYDLESGPHRVRLLEHDLELSGSHWAVRALLKLALVIVPILLIAGTIALLKVVF